MSRIMKSGKFDRSRQLQRCAESGTPRICYYTGFQNLMMDSARRRLLELKYYDERH